MAAGSNALVEVQNADSLPAVTAQSSDPSVMTLRSTFRSSVFLLTAHGAGAVELQLRNADGSLFESFPLTVHDVATIEVPDLTGDAPIRATAQKERHEVRLLDASGERLHGSGALHYEASPHVDAAPFSVAETLASRFQPGADWPANTEGVDISGDLSGEMATVTASAASGASLVIPVDVVAPDIASLVLTGTDTGSAAMVHADFQLTNPGPGIWACCDWSVTASAAVEVSSQTCTDIAFSSPVSSMPNDVTVTCDAHGHSESFSATLGG